jgi:hypothetical protein
MLEEAAAKFHLNADFSDNAGFKGSGDHVLFVAKQVPTRFVYHQVQHFHGVTEQPREAVSCRRARAPGRRRNRASW